MTTGNGFERIVILGASNVARGLHVIVETARNRWGPEIEIVAAQGHGRSYAVPSKMLFRSISGIVDCGLWPALETMPPAKTLALITDVGNDILYGHSPARILEWVENCIDRLGALSCEILIADLPMASVRRISPAKFRLMRSILFSSSRQTLDAVIAASEEISVGLARIAASRHFRFIPMRDEWYGFDPIHIRARHLRQAWSEMLCSEPASAAGSRIGFRESFNIYFMRPEYRRIFGIEQHLPQTGFRSPNGGRIWLY